MTTTVTKIKTCLEWQGISSDRRKNNKSHISDFYSWQFQTPKSKTIAINPGDLCIMFELDNNIKGGIIRYQFSSGQLKFRVRLSINNKIIYDQLSNVVEEIAYLSETDNISNIILEFYLEKGDIIKNGPIAISYFEISPLPTISDNQDLETILPNLHQSVPHLKHNQCITFKSPSQNYLKWLVFSYITGQIGFDVIYGNHNQSYTIDINYYDIDILCKSIVPNIISNISDEDNDNQVLSNSILELENLVKYLENEIVQIRNSIGFLVKVRDKMFRNIDIDKNSIIKSWQNLFNGVKESLSTEDSNN